MYFERPVPKGIGFFLFLSKLGFYSHDLFGEGVCTLSFWGGVTFLFNYNKGRFFY